MRGRLILILGDQLSPGLSSLQAGDPATDRVLLAEVMAEASYVPHHKKKLAFVFSAMRHFAEELRGLGWQVDYVKLHDPGNSGSLGGEVQQALGRHGLTRVLVTEPGEWRLLNEMSGWPDAELLPDVRFIADRRLQQLGLQPLYHIKKNPLPWLDEMLNAIEHTNFFENRATEYSKASTSGSWEEAFA